MSFDQTSRLAALRAGTRAAHASMETVPAMKRLVSPDLTRDEYVSVLRHMHAFHAHAEPLIAEALHAMPEAASMLDGARPRALARDLAWFGAAPVPPPRLPPIDGAAAALGALYVIEGSGLGGRVIARHLAASLGVGDSAGGSFYGRQDADAVRLRWNRLTALLEAAEADTHAMIAGARTLFECLEHWLRTSDAVAMADAVAP